MKGRVWPWLVGALLFGVGSSAQESYAREGGPTVERGTPIWVLGDSIGVGIADALRRAGVQVVEKATIGTNARQWRKKVTEIGMVTDIPRVVVVSLGTNDQASLELLREWRTNVRAIMAELQARGHRVIWVLPPSTYSKIPQGNDLEFLVGLGGQWVRDTGLPMADKWHPTAAGYDALARAVLSL